MTEDADSEPDDAGAVVGGRFPGDPVAGRDDSGDGLDDPGGSDGVPDFPAAREHVLTELLRFVNVLRSEGVSVPATGASDAARALAVVGLADEARVETAMRATLLSDPADAEPFAEAFPTFWHRLRSGISRIATAEDGPSPDRGGDADDPDEPAEPRHGSDDERSEADRLEDAEPPEFGGGDDGDVDVRIPTDRRHADGTRAAETAGDDARRYSAVGGSHLVAAGGSPADVDLAAVDRFVDALATLPGRRRRPADDGRTVDARRALRTSLSTGGTPMDLPRSDPAESELRCCLLIDVSGSVLDTIDRHALLAFAERAVDAAYDARVFLFDTDLVEATEAFRAADGDPAGALRAAEVEWGGGTRIGHALDRLRRTDPHAVDRRTVVVVVSDGLDVGDPDRLADGITWLADRAGDVVWLNPLAVSRSFEPAARGMAGAEPYVDALFGFATAADLDAAARQLERRGLDGAVGYEHDVPVGGGAGPSNGGERP